MASSDIYVARESFSTDINGVPVAVHKGVTRVRDGHPLLRRYRQNFELLTVHFDVEQATQAPGEARGRPTRPNVDPDAVAAAKAAGDAAVAASAGAARVAKPKES